MNQRFVFQFVITFVTIFFIQNSIASQINEIAVDKVKGALSLIVLGSGGAIATPKGRAGSGYLIFADGKLRILMDAGSGVFTRIAQSGADLSKLDTILYTHLHIDHTADTSAILKSVYLHNLRSKTKRSASMSPVHFYGPAANSKLPQAAAYDHTSQYVTGLYGKESGIERYIHGFVKAINAGEFGYEVTDVPANQFKNVDGVKKPADIKTIIRTPDGLVVKAIGVNHGPVPSLAFRIEYKGKSIVYSGDTTSKTNNMIKLSKKADILIYDAAIMDDIPPSGSVFRKFHTSPTRMGQVATQAASKFLLLSHISPITDKRIDQLKLIVKRQGFTGVITEANDLDVYNLD